MQAADHIDGGLSVSAAFHVDTDEGVGGDGVPDESGDDFLGQAGIEIHAHLGELYADIGVQVAGLDGVEQAMVDVGGVAGFFGGRDIFAQAVEGRSDAGACRDSAEPRTSSSVMPATKREDILRPIADRSEKLRRVALRERAINVERRMGITSLKIGEPSIFA